MHHSTARRNIPGLQSCSWRSVSVEGHVCSRLGDPMAQQTVGRRVCETVDALIEGLDWLL